MEFLNQITLLNTVLAFSDANSTAGDFSVRLGAAANDFVVYTNGASERMRIDSSGNVGIGTTSPAYPIDIKSSTNIARFESTTNGIYNEYKNNFWYISLCR